MQRIIKDPMTLEGKRALLQADIWEALGYPKCMGCFRILPPMNMAPSGFCWTCIYSGVADRVLQQGWPNLSASRREIGTIVKRTKRILRGKEKGYRGIDQ